MKILHNNTAQKTWMILKPFWGEMWPGHVFGVTDPGTPSGTVKVNNSLHKWIIWAQLLDNGADLWP